MMQLIMGKTAVATATEMWYESLLHFQGSPRQYGSPLKKQTKCKQAFKVLYYKILEPMFKYVPFIKEYFRQIIPAWWYRIEMYEL